jgi:hypothetical protein
MHFFTRFLSAVLMVVLATGSASANPETRLFASAPPVLNVASTASVHVIANDRGGSVVGYAQEVQRLRNQDKLVVFNGQCASACTMFLSLNSKPHLHRARCVLRVPPRLWRQRGHERMGNGFHGPAVPGMGSGLDRAQRRTDRPPDPHGLRLRVDGTCARVA